MLWRSLPCPSACLAAYRRCASALHGLQVRCLPSEYQSECPHFGHTGLLILLSPELIMGLYLSLYQVFRVKLGHAGHAILLVDHALYQALYQNFRGKLGHLWLLIMVQTPRSTVRFCPHML